MNKILQFLQPLLISSYAVLFTYLSAIGEVSFFEFSITYLFVLTLSFSLIFFFNFIYKSFSKAFVFTTFFLLFFWNVTPISRTLYNFSFFGIQIFRLRYLIPVTLIFLLILFIRLFESKEKTYFLSTFFFYPYLILNLFCIFNIIQNKIVINKLIGIYESNSAASQAGLDHGVNITPRVASQNAPLPGANKCHPFHGLSNENLSSVYNEQHDGIGKSSVLNTFVVDKLSNGRDQTSKRSTIVSPVQAAKRCSSGFKNIHKLSPSAGRYIKPDIYFIVLDTYLSQEALKQNFDFDNNEFLKNLQKKGFKVLNNAYSNYPETVSSLSATLNMDYHENVKSGDQQQFFGLGFYKNRNNLVSKILKSVGYKIINIPSVWGDIPKNNFADVDYYSSWPKRFFANLLERMSIISPFVYLYIGYNSRNVFFEQLKTIENHIKDFSPKFIFAHILMPHAPFVFTQNGNKTNSANWLDDNKLYLGQLKFVNKKIEELIDKILKNSQNPPIIILQADHGLNAGIMFSDYSKINEIDKKKLIKSFGILNVVYYPDLNDVSLSPINNFRFIFNKYIGANFELLKDETFVGPDEKGKFIKVESLREKSNELFK